MPNGAKPGGSVLSVNELTRVKVPSYTSTLLLALSAAYRKVPEGLLGMAKPVYTAPGGVLGAMRASLGLDCGAQPLMVPSKVAKMKKAVHPCSWNSDEPLKTIPVA